MKWEDCKKCPEFVCSTGVYNKSVIGEVVSYARGSILKTPEVHIRPICLLKDHFRIDYLFVLKADREQKFNSLQEALTYLVENVKLSFESLLYYTKIKNEINDYNS